MLLLERDHLCFTCTNRLNQQSNNLGTEWTNCLVFSVQGVLFCNRETKLLNNSKYSYKEILYSVCITYVWRCPGDQLITSKTKWFSLYIFCGAALASLRTRSWNANCSSANFHKRLCLNYFFSKFFSCNPHWRKVWSSIETWKTLMCWSWNEKCLKFS